VPGSRAILSILVAFLLLLPIAVSCQANAKSTDSSETLVAGTPAPAEFRDLYAALKGDLDGFDTYLGSKDGGTPYPVVFGAELLAANGNRGTDLLKPGTLQGTFVNLDSLQKLGVQGVTINVPYPLYTPDFPQYQDYVNYFRQVAAEVHRRGMKLDVETGVVFHDTEYSPIKVDFSGLTLGKYESDARQMVQAIISDMHPDYLDLGAEPDTHSALLGLPELNNPQDYTQYVNYVLNGLDRGSTRVAAGMGTWSNIAFAENLAKNTTLDCVAIHVYPVLKDWLTKAASIAQIATANGKQAILDECWLYKTTAPPADIADTISVYRLDAYSFWTPLDEQFLAGMAKLCRVYGIEYMSPFWAYFFFGNLDYSAENARLTYTETVTQANRVATQNILDGKRSALGDFYASLIEQNR